MICPDCKQPVETHAAYRDGRCPVVRFTHYQLDQPGAPAFTRPLRPCPPRELGQR